MHGYQAYVCLFRPEEPTLENVHRFHEHRNALMAELESRGIATRQGTHSPILSGYYAGRYGLRAADYPNSVLADRLSLALPLYPQMTDAEQEIVVRRSGAQQAWAPSKSCVCQARRKKGRVLFVGQSYYHAWYLSRELRKPRLACRRPQLGPDSATEMYYHGEDYRLRYKASTTATRARGRGTRTDTRSSSRGRSRATTSSTSATRMESASAHALRQWAAERFPDAAEIRLLKRLGKKIVYSNNGCLDGVLQSTFDAWGAEPTCEICPWRERCERVQRRDATRLG